MKRPVKRHEVIQPLDPSYRLIALTQGQNAIVDTVDFEWLNGWNWCAVFCKTSNGFYVERGEHPGGRKLGRTIKFRMHRVILGCKPHEKSDHKNGNTLDNRRQNLRRCTTLDNAKNRKKVKIGSSRFKGVSWHKESEKWQARITAVGHMFHLGKFSDEQEAARAYDAAAKIHHGDFAQLNFPPKD